MSDAPPDDEDPRALFVPSRPGVTVLPGILDEDIERLREFIRASRPDATYRAYESDGWIL